MQTLRWKMGLWAALMTCTLIVGSSGQCFSDDNGADRNVNIQADTSTEYALKLLKTFDTGSRNIIIHPFCIRAVFDVAYLGANGNTKAEISEAFVLGNVKQSKLAEIYPELVHGLEHNATQDANYDVNSINRIYFDKNLNLKECMVKNIPSDIQQADFREDPEASRLVINKFVKDETNNEIKEFIKIGDIPSGTTMVLVNAVYFKADWKYPFDPKATQKETFCPKDDIHEIAPIMHQKIKVPYGKSSLLDCTAVSLPYAGDEMELLVVLPNNNKTTPTDLLAKLNEAALKDLRANLKETNIDLALPKLNMPYSYDMTENLKSLGVKDAFDSSKADFSGFTTPGSNKAFIGTVQHKTFFKVDEYGSGAVPVAATTTSAIVPEVKFSVTRSFLFFLINTKYNYIITMGVVNQVN